MSGDYSRKRFNPEKHYQGVLRQQGRVDLDAESNENVDLQDRRWRAETSDIVGPSGVPSETPDGFKIAMAAGQLTVGQGRVYVDGFLAENHGAKLLFNATLEEKYGTAPLPVDDQPYGAGPVVVPQQVRSLVYLDVWRREVTYLQEPQLIEPAVNVETTTRYQTAWQVKLFEKVASDVTCKTPFTDIADWPAANLPSAARLTTTTVAVTTESDPDLCLVPPSGGYRGLENHLYRVEVHDVMSTGAVRVKWSRENAHVASQIVEILTDGTGIKVESLGRDDVLCFNNGDWVEITSDKREFAGLPGEMRKVVTVDDTNQEMTFSEALPLDEFPEEAADAATHLRVIRWDQSGSVRKADGSELIDLDLTTDGLILLTAANPSFVLEHGIQVTLSIPAGGTAHTGDYWCFAARTADADIERLDAAPPAGIHHHFCKLAIVEADGSITDCRPLFPSLTELDSLFYISGDGQEAMPGQALARPLQVGVAHGRWPVPGVGVIFTITGGTGTLTAPSGAGSTLTVATNASGVAEISWTLDAVNGSQQVQAFLANGTHLPVRFNANLSQASAVAYVPTSLCPDLVAANVQTVQQALDQICQAREREPGIHVKGINLINGDILRNDTEVTVDRLSQGITVVCDANLDPSIVKKRDGFPPLTPNCFVSLALPFPLNSNDRELWGDRLIGFQPLLLAATVDVDDNALFWVPIGAVQAWLTGPLFSILTQLGREGRVLARLTLKGNFIWDRDDATRYLDGEVFGFARDTTNIDARLPSGDGRRGGDLELWFWLVPSQALPLSPIGHSVTSTPTDIQAGVVGVLGELRLTKVGANPQGTFASSISLLYLGVQISNTFPGSVAMNPATGTITANGITILLTGGWRNSGVTATAVNTAVAGLITVVVPQGLVISEGDLIAVNGVNAFVNVTGGDVTVSLTSVPSTAHIFVNTPRAVVANVLTGKLILNVSVIRNRVEGTVLDNAGAAIAGASVTLTGTSGTRSTVTNAQGGFSFANTPAGDYTVVAQFGAFSAQRTVRVGLIVVDPTIPPIVDPGVLVPVGPVTPLTPVGPVGPIRRLDEIEGIGEVFSARLVQNGIADPAALVSTDPARLAQILRVAVNQAKTFIDRARRLLG